MILAIDPGTTHSAYLTYVNGDVLACDIVPNSDLIDIWGDHVHRGPIAIEMVASYGMPVGREVFETCVWIGRFIEALGGGDFVYRKDVKMHLCQSMRAKDANIRRALLDKFARTGGGSTPQVGTKLKPGPLYGVKSHIWSALAVAVSVKVRQWLPE